MIILLPEKIINSKKNSADSGRIPYALLTEKCLKLPNNLILIRVFMRISVPSCLNLWLFSRLIAYITPNYLKQSP